jgi:EAL domain-containing protein (putative c-di-GMP-specific phosphodiesterase class I)
VFVKASDEKLEKLVNDIVEHLGKYDLPFEIACNIGIYVTCEEQVAVNAMLDRAMLAQSTVKGSYVTKFNYYNQKMRDEMLTEQEVVGIMSTALAERQFVVYYQPQYDHSTGVLVGAEALVRWKHPEKGLISPGIFIPIFEKNGFITKLDLCVFEEVCLFLRKCLDNNLKVVPISSNFSRHDIFQPDFISRLEGIRQKYDIPSKLLRVEITESAITGSGVQANEIVRKLHNCGYVVEMDDFGSGYSSLNLLSKVSVDTIKLDKQFLDSTLNATQEETALTIIKYLIRMLKHLGFKVLAEGVETEEQLEMLKRAECDIVQGYYYSKPVPLDVFTKMLPEVVSPKEMPCPQSWRNNKMEET